ncbi:unnamed protein product, partial [Ectocarpus fasciculatus]
MAQKLVVLHNGTRKTVPIGPRMIVQELVQKVAELYSIDCSDSVVSLQHKHSKLNPAEVVFHLGIPNNACIDVVVTSRKSSSGGSTKLTLVGRDKASWTGTLSSGSTLREVLSALGAVDSTAVARGASAVGLIYMRKPFQGDALDGTTLDSLGLTGQAAKMQLVFGETPPPAPASVMAPVAVPQQAPAPEGPVGSSAEWAPLPELPSPAEQQSLPPTYTVAAESVEQECDKAMQLVLSNNFDAASQAGILLFFKYIDNILKHPGDSRYTRIPTTNKVYIEKLDKLRGASDFLQAIGFIRVAPDASVWEACAEVSSRGVEHWRAVRRALVRAAETLGLGADQYSLRPPSAPAVPVAAIAFDPFRAMVTKTASTEGSQYLSVTERRLADIEQRRAQLEGSPADVERCTEVSLVLRQTVGVDLMDTDDDSASRVDSKLLAQHLAAKHKAGNSSDEAPLLTNAVRLLEKAKKEKVYSSCVVRIRFPDKVILQGCFHPRDRMSVVYEWVGSCLQSAAVGVYLYMSPPKVIYGPDNELTLQELGMVPAVNLFAGWAEHAAP